MEYIILVRPIIGAVIGYVTNYIAVKMLFRPVRPIKIGKIKLPFTPGVIPKNKERIAKSIGDTISTHLLRQEELSKSLLSEDKKKLLYDKITSALAGIPQELTVKEEILKFVSEDSYEEMNQKLNEMLTKKIITAMTEEETRKMIAEQIEKVANEKVNGSMFSLFGINSVISNLAKEIANKIHEYLLQNGNTMFSKIITKEMKKVENEPLNETIQMITNSQIDIASGVVNIYEKVITDELPDILKAIDISQMVTDRINAMDMLELEKLILGIMKKELNALINLGALIGFLLGLINLLI